MKKIRLILILVFGFLCMYGQSIKPEVIASSGGYYESNIGAINWTLGECITETFSNGTFTLTQGFQQGVYEINTAIDNTENQLKITVYPNPAIDFIRLEIQPSLHNIYSFVLTDSNGKCLKQEKITSERTKIELVGYSSNAFILNVFTANQMLLKSFKIIKTN